MAISRPRSPPLAPRWGLSSRGSEAHRDPIAASVGDDRRPHGSRFLSVANPFPHGPFGRRTEHPEMVGPANCVLPAPDGRMEPSRQSRQRMALRQCPRPYSRVAHPPLDCLLHPAYFLTRGTLFALRRLTNTASKRGRSKEEAIPCCRGRIEETQSNRKRRRSRQAVRRIEAFVNGIGDGGPWIRLFGTVEATDPRALTHNPSDRQPEDSTDKLRRIPATG
jgi:hypothetical protein